MSDSWDWMDEHKKKERQRKRFFIFCLFVSLPALLITIPSMLSPAPDPKPPREPDLKDALTVGEPPLDHSTSETIEPPTTDATVTVTPTPNVSEAENALTKSMASTPAKASSKPFTAPAEPETKPDPMLPKVQRSLAKLTRQLEEIGQERLDQYGGEQWQAVSKLMNIASDRADTSAAFDAAEEALDRIDALSLYVDTAELLKTTKSAKPSDLLAAFVDFRGKHPGMSLPQIDERIRKIPREAWLQLATDELSSASPDDSGFAEGWMPVAGAWQLVGNDREAREAIRRAREALPRMTKVERIVESTIDLCQHESFDPKDSEQLIADAAGLCPQVSSTSSRSRYYANLSGLSARFGHRPLASQLLEKSLALIDMSDGANTSNKAVYTQQFKAAAWTEPPETIFAICSKLDKLKYPKLYINANGYAHAAMAAARHNDRRQFLRGMFTAETHLAQFQSREYPYYLFVARLAEANLLQRRWRAAVIIANNIPDPYVRASILFRVMKDAPQEVYSPHLPDLFERFADQRWAAPAVAGHVEHRIRSGDSLLEVVAWSKGLPLASQRTAAYAGIARATGTVSSNRHNHQSVAVVSESPDIENSVSLIESAEHIADTIEDPLQSAFAWLRIARTWNLLDKTQRYRNAVQKVHDRLFDAWKQVWDDRPPVKKSYNGGYVDIDDRHKPKERQTIANIITCLWRLSELQTDLGDAGGAMETCLDIATAANAVNAMATYNDENFLHLKAIAHRLESETGVGPDSFPYTKHLSYRYTRALLAARAKDIAGLQAAIPELVKHSQRKHQSKKEYAKPGRAYAELAILFAERGDVKSYRDARRSAESRITQGASPSEYKIMLATADAYAGELALAESNLVRGSVRWFGDANRPRSRLAIELSKTGKWADAIEHAKNISGAFPAFRADAWAALAKSRYQNEQTDRDNLLEWSASMESPLINVSILCGFGLSASAQQ